MTKRSNNQERLEDALRYHTFDTVDIDDEAVGFWFDDCKPPKSSKLGMPLSAVWWDLGALFDGDAEDAQNLLYGINTTFRITAVCEPVDGGDFYTYTFYGKLTRAQIQRIKSFIWGWKLSTKMAKSKARTGTAVMVCDNLV